MAHRSMIDETDVVKLHRAALSLTSSTSSSPSESWQSHVSIRVPTILLLISSCDLWMSLVILQRIITHDSYIPNSLTLGKNH